MTSLILKRKILKKLDLLSFDEQLRVLDFTSALTDRKVVGVSGQELLHFAGKINSNDLEYMQRAIEDECERIDVNEW